LREKGLTVSEVAASEIREAILDYADQSSDIITMSTHGSPESSGGFS